MLFLLLSFNIIKKLVLSYREKRSKVMQMRARMQIESFLFDDDEDFTRALEVFVRETKKRNKKMAYFVNDYLITSLESPGNRDTQRLIAISNAFDFYPDVLEEIKSRNPVVSARGARRAGFYNFKDATNDMLNALEILSSENQFEILMGLARMGRAEPMQQAFEKIKNSIIVNERAIIEILSTFPEGPEKLKLFIDMFQNETPFLVVLFLKSVDAVKSIILIDRIFQLLKHEDKYIRAAAVRALSTLKEQAPENELIVAMQDTEWEVRALASKALAIIDTPKTSLALLGAMNDRQWVVRQNATNALSNHLGAETLFTLVAELGSKYSIDSMISLLELKNQDELLELIKKLAV